MNLSGTYESSLRGIGLAAVVFAAACSTPPSEAPAATVRDTPTTPTPPTTPAPSGARETIALTPANTTIAFTAAKVSASHEGGFRDHAGTVELDPAHPEASTIHIVIQAGSIFADQDRLTNHLKSPDFFDVERFPTATFHSTSIRPGGNDGATHTITGTLEMHGQTRELTFPATVTVAADRLRANATFSINRRDWGLVYPGMPDDLIRDTVDMRLTIDAPRAPH